MTFKTSLDNTAIAITIGVSILFACSIVGQYSLIDNVGSAGPFVLTTIFLLTYSFSFAFRPVSYIIKPGQVVVSRLLLDVHIERSDIKSVKLLDKKAIEGSIRTFGVGGLFGYYGKFAKAGLGNMTWYATHKDHMVIIETIANKKIVLSPNDPEKFVAELTLIDHPALPINDN